MPSNKRSSSENHLYNDEQSCQDSFSLYHRKQFRYDRQDHERDGEDQANHDHDDDVDDDDSDGGYCSSGSNEKPECIEINQIDVRKLVQCPICLGIIKKTRTVMECMHRFCRECIDKSMRLGNNECPTCRTHCASRRSLRDDPRFDSLIAHLFDDINKYEEEELAFHEEEKTRNKQIQVSIAEIVELQEILVRKRTPTKDSACGYIGRSHKNYKNAHLRGRRKYGGSELQASDDSEGEHGNGRSKDTSSASEIYTEVKPRKSRIRLCNNISSTLTPNGTSGVNHIQNIEIRGISPGISWKPEVLSWGKGGIRSQTRHGIGSNGKNAQSTHLIKLTDHLQRVEENGNELDVHIMLVSLDKQNTPSLEQPFLCCHPCLPVKHLSQYVANQTHLRVEEVQIFSVKGHSETRMDDPNHILEIGSCQEDLQVLEGEETLGGLKVGCLYTTNFLILAYRQKDTTIS